MRRLPGWRTCVAMAATLSALACDTGVTRMELPPLAPTTVRVALFNVQELSADKIGEVDGAGRGTHPQLFAAAEIIAAVAPDILVLNEVDHDYENAEYTLTTAARDFATAYIQAADPALVYAYAYAGYNNTGILSDEDLNGDGIIATSDHEATREHGEDSFGFGVYPGQYSMAVLSRYPIISGEARTFRDFLWRDLPGNHIPEGFYSEDALGVLRLSSKSHEDVPVAVDGHRLHLFLSHPTPPVFDGDEDRNGRRNFDELMLWRLYLDGEPTLVDDLGNAGGYAAGEPFVIIGDLNADEGGAAVYDGVSAIGQLLQHTAVQDPREWVVSDGAPDNPRATTAFGGAGRRIDYVLPSRGIEVVDGGVYWPDADADPEGNIRALLASDHRLVWLDLALPGE